MDRLFHPAMAMRRPRRWFGPWARLGAFLCALVGFITTGALATTKTEPVISIEPNRPIHQVQIRLDHVDRSSALFAVLVEAHLFDLPSVTPRLSNASPHLLLGYTPRADRGWRLDLEIVRKPPFIESTATLRDEDREMSVSYSRVPESQFDQAARDVATMVSEKIGVKANLRPRRLGQNEYARYLLTQTAGALFGLGKANLKQSALRTLEVDATLDLARVLLARNEPSTETQRMMDLAHFDHVGDLAMLAVTRFENRDLVGAWHVWVGLEQADALDHKFNFVAAACAAGAGEEAEAYRILQKGNAHPRWGDTLLDVGRALGHTSRRSEYLPDALLADWQISFPSNLMAVRLRVDRFIETGQLDSASKLLSELERRGAAHDSSELRLALLAEKGNYREAARAAQLLNHRELAIRLRVAANDLPARSVLQDVRDRAVRLKRAKDWLVGFQPQRALHELEEILQEDPWWTEALVLKRQALLGLGQKVDASKVEQQILYADPLYFEDRP